MVFYSQKEMAERAKKYEENSDDEDAMREMNEYEEQLMKKFEENDQEIDDMLDEVIAQVDRLKYQAEGIQKEILN